MILVKMVESVHHVPKNQDMFAIVHLDGMAISVNMKKYLKMMFNLKEMDILNLIEQQSQIVHLN
jgi:hypothetical protein